MVLQILRLRLVTLAERLGKARGIERALTTYLPEPPDEVLRGLQVTRECVSRIVAVAGPATVRRWASLLLPARFQLDDADFGNLRAAAAAAGHTLVRDGATALFRRRWRRCQPACRCSICWGRSAPTQDPRSLYFAEDGALHAARARRRGRERSWGSSTMTRLLGGASPAAASKDEGR